MTRARTSRLNFDLTGTRGVGRDEELERPTYDPLPLPLPPRLLSGDGVSAFTQLIAR
jgi:hypothetical protein